MDYKDYYKILGVNKNASTEEIKKAYRKLAREYHPDVNPDNAAAEERFKEINEANEVLTNPEKRAKYDRLGSSWQNYQSAGNTSDFDWSQWFSGSAQRNSGDFSDFFEAIFGGFGGSNVARKGRDITREVEITLEEAYHGTSRILLTSDNRRIEVKIPRGAKKGTKVRIKGEGGSGSGGGPNGDLYLKVNIAQHPNLTVDGEDLHLTAPLDLYTALLGGELEIETLKGTLKLKIPPETQNGKIFRLKGQGMPKLNDPTSFGDLYVETKVRLPQGLSPDEQALLWELRDMRPDG